MNDLCTYWGGLNMVNITIQESLALEPVQPFDELVDLTLQTVAASSARVYRQTYTLWRTWCLEHALLPLDLRPGGVLAFLSAQPIAKATRQRQLSALRKLAQMHYILSPSDQTRQIFEALRVVKAPGGTAVGGEGGNERTKKALAPSEADKVLCVWDETTNQHRRNRALIAVLALGSGGTALARPGLRERRDYGAAWQRRQGTRSAARRGVRARCAAPLEDLPGRRT